MPPILNIFSVLSSLLYGLEVMQRYGCFKCFSRLLSQLHRLQFQLQMCAISLFCWQRQLLMNVPLIHFYYGLSRCDCWISLVQYVQWHNKWLWIYSAHEALMDDAAAQTILSLIAHVREVDSKAKNCQLLSGKVYVSGLWQKKFSVT